MNQPSETLRIFECPTDIGPVHIAVDPSNLSFAAIKDRDMTAYNGLIRIATGVTETLRSGNNLTNIQYARLDGSPEVFNLTTRMDGTWNISCSYHRSQPLREMVAWEDVIRRPTLDTRAIESAFSARGGAYYVFTSLLSKWMFFARDLRVFYGTGEELEPLTIRSISRLKDSNGFRVSTDEGVKLEIMEPPYLRLVTGKDETTKWTFAELGQSTWHAGGESGQLATIPPRKRKALFAHHDASIEGVAVRSLSDKA